MVVLDMLTRTPPVLRRSASLKWAHEHTPQHHHRIKRMPSPSPTRIITKTHNTIKHVQSMPTISSPIGSNVKTVHIPIPIQSPSPHAPHQATPYPHPRSTLRPSRQSPPMTPSSSSMPSLSLSPVATPTRPPLLRRTVTPTRPSLLRRTAAHLDNTPFERVTRRRLLSPTPITTTSSTTTITAPPPSPTSPVRRRIPRRFTFAPIHIVTSQLRDAHVTQMEHDMIRYQHQHEHEHEHEQQQQQQQQQVTPAKDLVKWWAEQEAPVWQPPPALHTLIEDDWEERQQPHHIATQASCTSSTSTATSSRTPLRPPPILLPNTISSTPAYRYNPITPTCPTRELELQSPPICQDTDIPNIMVSPSFANLSMEVDMMATLPKGWQTQDMGHGTPSPTITTTSTWTPRVIDELTQDIGKWISMDTQ